MKPKQIIILVIAFVVLTAIYFMQKQKKQTNVIQGLGYEKVLGKKLATSDINEFKCYVEGKEEKTVHLVKSEGKWIVKSKFDAPAKEEAVKSFLKKLEKLEGELRSSSKEVLADYGLKKEEAIHLILFDRSGKEKKHLLLGKRGPAWNETFVRLQGSNDVYLVNENLRSEFGVYSNDVSPDLDTKKWCDLVLLKLPEEKVVKVEQDLPYRRLVMELQEKVTEAVSSATDVTPPPPEKEWVVIEPKMDKEFKESGINRLVRAFANVNVSDVVAKGDLASYGLDKPLASCTVTSTDTKTYRLLFGKEVPNETGAYYVTLEGNDLVYKMAKWKIQSIFLKMSDLVNLNAPGFAKDDITTISLKINDKKLSFNKKDAVWHSTEPSLDEYLKTAAVEKIVTGVSRLNPEDRLLLPNREMTGLDKPTATISFSLKGAKDFTIKIGQEVPFTGGGRFIQLMDRKEIWVISNSKWQELSPKISQLFDLDLFNFNPKDIVAINIKDSSGELPLMLTEKEVPSEATGEPPTIVSQWEIVGQDKVANKDKINELLNNLVNLNAVDIFAKADKTGLEEPAWTAKISDKNNKEYKLSIGGLTSKAMYYGQVGDKKAIFELPPYQSERLMILSKESRK